MLSAMHEWPKPVLHVFQQLLQAGYEAFAVGGYVRDTLLGRTPNDYDVTTNATPLIVRQLFARTVATGLQHGTVTVLVEGYPVEVTTYRVDAEYSDGRHPDGVRFTQSLEEDLRRRDFTINAMAMSIDGVLVDRYGGLSDLKNGCIRAVGDPLQRFHEDGLRILRSFRFAAQLGFDIDRQTLSAMECEAHMLRNVSGERIGIEFEKLAQGAWWKIAPLLAQGPWWSYFFDPVQDLGIGLARFVEMDLNRRWRWVIHLGTRLIGHGQQTKRASGAMTDLRLIAAISCWAWLADYDKSKCRKLCRIFGWSNERGRLLSDVIEIMKSDLSQANSKLWRHYLYDYGYFANLVASMVQEVVRNKPLSEKNHARHRPLTCLRALQHHAAHQPIWDSRDLAVNGHDIIALGLAGPDIGQMLQRLIEAVLVGDVVNEKEPLLNLANVYLRAER